MKTCNLSESITVSFSALLSPNRITVSIELIRDNEDKHFIKQRLEKPANAQCGQKIEEKEK